MKKKKKISIAEKVVWFLTIQYEVTPFLHFSNPWELLIATILSAQCTDQRVNQVTPALFRFLPTPKHASLASPSQIEPYIQSVNYFHTKAQRLHENGVLIEANFQGVVPSSMEELITLKGVGRKTANVVLAQAFHKAQGVAVDTHVSRTSKRLGWANSAMTPDDIEKVLMDLFPSDLWEAISILLIHHGRTICKARKPLCHECIIRELCPSQVSKI
jgi:endonuclease-3